MLKTAFTENRYSDTRKMTAKITLAERIIQLQFQS